MAGIEEMRARAAHARASRGKTKDPSIEHRRKTFNSVFLRMVRDAGMSLHGSKEFGLPDSSDEYLYRRLISGRFTIDDLIRVFDYAPVDVTKLLQAVREPKSPARIEDLGIETRVVYDTGGSEDNVFSGLFTEVD